METSLHDLLRASSNPESNEYTHKSLYGPSKNWSLNDDSYTNFWEKYCEISETPENNKKKLCLAEIPRKHMPVISDLTLKFHPLDKEPYDEDFILAIVFCYQQVIKETLNISEDGPELICCVLKGPTFVEDNLIVCKIRLQFPYCKTVCQIQNRLIRPLVLQMFRTTKVISRLETQPVNEWEDIVDPLSVEKPVVMYGSSQSQNSPKLALEYIFPQVLKSDIDGCETRVLELSETFFPQNHEQASSGIIDLNMFGQDLKDIDHDFWLPYFLSIYYLKEITLPKNGNNLLKGNGVKRRENNCDDTDCDDPEYLSSTFLGMLSNKRFEEEHFWLDVGKSLYNTFDGEERGLEKWIDFTRSSKIFKKEDCESKYYTFNSSFLSIKTLAFYAKQDNYEEYYKWHQSWYLPFLEKATSCCHSDVAEAIYRVYWLEYACSNVSKSILYHFDKHLWKRLDSGIDLKNMISGDFITILEKFRLNIAVDMQNSKDKNFRDSAEIMVQKIGKLKSKLKNRTFKNAIYSESCDKFYIEDFDKRMDSSPDLMGCLNGVIEVLHKKAVFRKGKPEDFASKTTLIHYPTHLHKRHPLFLKLISYFRKVYPDKELLNYVGKLFAAALKGRNVDKIFPIHSGKGNNSKSMIKKLLECAFGDFAITMPTSIFTSNKSGGGPEPAIARSKYAHFAFAQEPDAETPLKSGIIKEFTGGDRFFVRFLNDNGGEISPMFTLNLFCNMIPIIPQCDQAIKNRVRCIPYLSTWQKDAPKNPDEQFKQRKFLLDPHFEDELSEMAPALLWWLVEEKYAEFRREGAYEPDIVKKYTAAYWEENDIYGQFVKENVEKVYIDDSKSEIDYEKFVTLQDFYNRFKEWFRDNYQLKLPDRQVFRNEIESRVTKCRERKFKGVKLKVVRDKIADV